MVAERALVMVWEGLRPDFVTAEQTPNLWQLIQRGVWFERSRISDRDAGQLAGHLDRLPTRAGHG